MSFEKFIEQKIAKSKKIRKILFIDGEDERALEAATLHEKKKLIEPIILLEKKSLNKKVTPLKKIIIDEWRSSEKEKILIEKYLEKRKGKETLEEAKKVIYNKNYFAMLMLELKEVDAVIGGLQAPTADILRPAFKIVGPKKGVKTISSVMIMVNNEERFIFSDISVNINPNEIQLAEIAKNASDFAKCIDLKPKIAFLSFSTSGSAVHPLSLLVKNARDLFNKKYKSKIPAIGEIQFDAAFNEKIKKSKYKEKSFKGQSNIYIFPSLNAGNIGYKIAQRMGKYGAVGPIITGINKPINDLSRGATTSDVYNTALISALQSIE